MLLKTATISITPGVASNTGQPGSHECAPPPPVTVGGGSVGSGGGGKPGDCYPVPIISGRNPDGTPIVIGFQTLCF